MNLHIINATIFFVAIGVNNVPIEPMKIDDAKITLLPYLYH